MSDDTKERRQMVSKMAQEAVLEARARGLSEEDACDILQASLAKVFTSEELREVVVACLLEESLRRLQADGKIVRIGDENLAVRERDVN